jgi:hypothetical protein
MVVAWAIVGCGSVSPSRSPDTTGASPSAVALMTAAPSPVASASPAPRIAQPDVGDLQVAPDAARVDLVMPTFSDSTRVTNPLFPVSLQESVLLLGEVDGQAFRTEVTLLPRPRIIDWDGRLVATLVSQYVAFLGGRIHEVAYDYYAQADDGSVWYFGEDVFDFADGAIVDTQGTWLTGTDGPAAMIMPAEPHVGDVYRTENAPGLAFEEVTVRGIDQTLDGPLGPVTGGLAVEELHMDGDTEDKTFGPGYGEFFTGGGGDVEALALAVPTDRLSGPVPAELVAVYDGATAILAAVRERRWSRASAELPAVLAGWQHVRTGRVPVTIAGRLDDALARLDKAVDRRRAGPATQAAIDVARSALDLELIHRPATAIDRGRFSLWLAQLGLDSKAHAIRAMTGDFFALDYTRERFLHTLASADAATVNLQLEALLTAIMDHDFKATSQLADQLRATIEGLPAVG